MCPDVALTTKLINIITTGDVRLMLTMAVAQFGKYRASSKQTPIKKREISG